MTKVLIVYCTLSDNTKKAAEAVAEGVSTAGSLAILKEGHAATAEDLIACDAVALGSYDAFNYMGGELKEFFDRAYVAALNKVDDKPYGVFLTHGGGGRALRSLEALAQWFKLKKAVESVSFKGKPEGDSMSSLLSMGVNLAVAAAKKPCAETPST